MIPNLWFSSVYSFDLNHSTLVLMNTLLLFSPFYMFLLSIVDPVVSDLRRVVGDDKFTPESPQHICNMLLTTVYMASSNSSEHTRTLAKTLASQIGRLDVFTDCNRDRKTHV